MLGSKNGRRSRLKVNPSRFVSNKLICFGLIALLLFSTCLAQSDNIPLKTDGTSTENYMEEKGVHYYKIKIPADFDRKSDLVITIEGKDARSDPDLHISSTNAKPTNMQDSEFSCAMVGEDICTIPSSALIPDKVFYVGAKCYRKCTYEISANLQTETELGGRKDYQIPMKAGDTKIFSFLNPHPGVKDLVFTARAASRTASIRMYIKDGKDSVPNTSDMRSSDGWGRRNCHQTY